METQRLYRICEVAAFFGLSKSKTYELARTGRLPYVRIDHSIRIRGADVLSFVESLSHKAA